jgi:metal-responsive CopG/Arc/MetJ family transcriptional regulator
LRIVVCIPNDLHRDAERAAARMRVSRSELYARALAEYLARRRQRAVTERLNAVYRGTPARLDPMLAAMQWSSLPAGEW